MAKSKKKQKKKKANIDGEQLDLIDVRPANKNKIIATARRYKKAQRERLAALDVEVAEKTNLLALVEEEKLQPLEDGSIRFQVDDMIITVKHRDALITVKEKDKNKDDE